MWSLQWLEAKDSEGNGGRYPVNPTAEDPSFFASPFTHEYTTTFYAFLMGVVD